MGSERVPEGPKMAPKTLLGPFGPILGYLGGGPCPKFLSPFGPKNTKIIFFSKKNLHYFDSQRVWDLQKPKVDPVDPPVDPFWPNLWPKRPILGSKSAFIKKNLAPNHFHRFPDGLGPSKTQNWPLKPQRAPFGRAPAPPVATQPAWSRT